MKMIKKKKKTLKILAKKLLKQTQHILLVLIQVQVKTRSGFYTTCQAEKDLFPTKK